MTAPSVTFDVNVSYKNGKKLTKNLYFDPLLDPVPKLAPELVLGIYTGWPHLLNYLKYANFLKFA